MLQNSPPLLSHCLDSMACHGSKLHVFFNLTLRFKILVGKIAHIQRGKKQQQLNNSKATATINNNR